MRRETLSLGQVQTRVCTWGEPGNLPVIALHSAGLDATSLERFAVIAAASDYFVLAPDLRGHGESEAAPHQVSLADMAEDVVDMAQQFSLKRPRLLGISLGGIVAGLVAAAAPERWTNLTVFCSPDQGYETFRDRAVATEQGMQSLMEETLHRWFTEDDIRSQTDFVVSAQQTLARMDPACWDALWRDFADFTGWRAACALDVLCVSGGSDKSTPPEKVGLIADVLKGRHVTISSAPHLLLISHAQQAFHLWQKFTEQWCRSSDHCL
ncbi:alpha/beta fold hydrolase [Nesterenkonia ebinurensis]|uniref:alpha/beta fold hydrolase n=1 Tax=Nesterenkonia ebinurensis TaxID=2608252 RepID=UPI00295EBAAB|nr:alpha/beta fold hydrolase [Nesterenkonia ebinurensis]